MESVLENHGFVLPNKALGPWKENRPPKDYVRNMTDDEYFDSSEFPSGASAWFKMSAPPFNDGPNAPIILSVTLMCQFLPSGFNGLVSYTVDHIMLNYSVDGSLTGIKPDYGINITKDSVSQSGEYWSTGYLDVTYDRTWTWTDLKNLRLHFYAKQVGDRKIDDRLLRAIAAVRYYDPKEAKPWFYATLNESGCKSLSISATIKSLDTDFSSSASALVQANPGACVPTPTNTRTPIPPTPTKTATLRPSETRPPTPVPTATPAPTAPPSQNPGISAVSSLPEPFKRGGVYVQFSLRNSVTGLKLKVFGADKSVLVTVDGGAFPAGQNQIFFDGLDDHHKALPPASYEYQIDAVAGTVTESYRGHFTRVADNFQ
jgi:hypothetical protein